MSLNLDCVGRKQTPYPFEIRERNVMLYALGVGADERELHYLFEGDRRFATLPTFAVIPPNRGVFQAIHEMGADLTKLVHGEQAIRWFAPIPTSGTVMTNWEVTHIYDKGSGALAVVTATTTTPDGQPIFENTCSMFVRGEGGFGGDRGPATPRLEPPVDRDPDFCVEERTQERQALIYRLNGDLNPLHASPPFAEKAGFEKPILHGLCTLGFVARALLNGALDADPARLKSLTARFSAVVFPGDLIVTRGWKMDDGRWVLGVSTDRGSDAITNCVAETD
ncbi:MAG: MaoC family dehydratase N-terminal domain-containing protein [Deltaproteobacteria bacterium]|nr:MaoC family dehydratase N-terminal domain-containing protein [Deltaproteobacteria bacterium]